MYVYYEIISKYITKKVTCQKKCLPSIGFNAKYVLVHRVYITLLVMGMCVVVSARRMHCLKVGG